MTSERLIERFGEGRPGNRPSNRPEVDDSTPVGDHWGIVKLSNEITGTAPGAATEPRYEGELEAERVAWYELSALVRSLTLDECLAPGYYRDPDWSVRDLAGHVGTWLAEAEVQFDQIMAGTYEGHDVDIDALNAAFLEAMHDQPWDVAWVQATAGRTMMLQSWSALPAPTDEAAWWIRKAGPEHYGEHLPRLREWVTELIGLREETPQP